MTTTKSHRADVLTTLFFIISVPLALGLCIWLSVDAWLAGTPWVAVIMAGFWTAVAIAIAYYKGGSDE